MELREIQKSVFNLIWGVSYVFIFVLAVEKYLARTANLNVFKNK